MCMRRIILREGGRVVKKLKFMKRLFAGVLCGLFAACAILVGGGSVYQRLSGVEQPMLFGWGMATILTGSMEPEIPVGALIIIHEKEVYQVGDAVTYIDSYGRSVTHRIVSLDGETVITQGDANNTEDKPFSEGQIIGKVVCILPWAGKAVSFLQRPVVLCGLLVAMCLIWFLPYRKSRKVED